ncbi:MAG: FixH family protein [Alphaproteobacteria bacterium]|nr:FixH family protein [Alphaproteobacteria bacterium]
MIWLWLMLSSAALGQTRLDAAIECAATARLMVYDCAIALADRQGRPVDGAKFKLGADMPSMPMAHNVRPVEADSTDAPGRYRARLELEMEGEWALRLEFSAPRRDVVVKRLIFDDKGGREGR